jgi:MFS family permease
VLRSPRLRRIIFAYAVNRVGTWIGLVALIVTVYEHTHDALAVSAMLVAAQALPALAVPAIVARVEASERRGELSALYLFEAAVTAGLVVCVWHFLLIPLLALVMLDGIAARAALALLRAELGHVAREDARLTDPGYEQLGGIGTDGVPTSLPADDEQRREEVERAANAALNVAFSVTFVTGPLLAGVLVATVGAPVALIVDAVSFVVCAALLVDLRPHIEEAASAGVRDRLRAAWRHVNESAALRLILLGELVAITLFEAGAPIEIAYAKTTLNAGSGGFGLLLTVWGAGTVIGSMVFARSMRRPLGYLLSGGTLAVGLGYAGFSLAPTLAAACGAALAGGMGNGVELPSLFSVVQKLAPPNLHGRLMGGVESMSAVCPLVGLPLGGALVALTTPRTAFLIVGVGIGLAALLLLVAARRGGLLVVTDAPDEPVSTTIEPPETPAKAQIHAE